ncbi:MAG: caspase family protein, partial [Bacteroidales bacterium]|nr:caspase family protein [Bacteroidales bacterium]
IKTDNNGNLLWDTTYGGAGTDIANNILKHNNNEFLILGSTTSKGKGQEDAWLLKIDIEGNLLWEKTIGDNSSDIANSGFYTSNGNCIICGTTSSTGNGGYDAWVIKLEPENSTYFDQTSPILTITKPATNTLTTTNQSIDIQGFTSDNNGIKNIFINGNTVSENAGYFSKTINLTTGINSIKIISTDNNYNSTTQTINITYYQPNNDVDNNIPICGKSYDNRYALIIGNEHYQENGSDIVSLNYTLNDAQIFKKYCVNVLGIPNDNSHIYYIEDATSMKMIQYIDMFSQLISLKEESEFFVYYSGHGTLDNQNNSYLIPVDVTSKYIGNYAFKLDDFYTKLAPKDSNRVYIFLDACFSGGGKNGALVQTAKVGLRRANTNTIYSNLIIFAASSGIESAQEYQIEQHGLFTYFLLKNLQQSQGNISWGELTENIYKDVLTATLNPANKLNTQTPTIQVNQSIQNTWKTWEINP